MNLESLSFKIYSNNVFGWVGSDGIPRSGGINGSLKTPEGLRDAQRMIACSEERLRDKPTA